MLKKSLAGTAQQVFEWGRLYRTKFFGRGMLGSFYLVSLIIYSFNCLASPVLFFLAGMPLQREPIIAFR